jgi:hypothetical protein
MAFQRGLTHVVNKHDFIVGYPHVPDIRSDDKLIASLYGILEKT